MNFKIGDTVKLKSGSVLMTITSESELSLGQFTCVYMVKGKVKWETFPKEALLKKRNN